MHKGPHKYNYRRSGKTPGGFSGKRGMFTRARHRRRY